MLRLQPVEPSPLVRARQVRLGLFCQRDEVRKMPVAPLAFLFTLPEPVPRILTHRLQQPVSGCASLLFGYRQILVG